MLLRRGLPLGLALATACTLEVPAILGPAGEDGVGEGSDELEGESEGGHVSLDLGNAERRLECELVPGELDAPLPCDLPAPSATIDVVVGWSWWGPEGEDSVLTTPLVGNFDDDDDSGTIDPCDGPDVVVIAVDLAGESDAPWPAGHVYVIEGRTGLTSARFDAPVDPSITPAFGDLDGDGRPELVAMQADGPAQPDAQARRRLIVFDHHGQVQAWGSWSAPQFGGGAIAIANLDGEGTPEILAPGLVANADATVRWWAPPVRPDATPIAVDLDLDGELEVMYGSNAYSADGEPLFKASGAPDQAGSSAIGNFDGDPFPEIHLRHVAQRILEHDGTIKATCPGPGGTPVALDDLDGDGIHEVVFSTGNSLSVIEIADSQCDVAWSYELDESDAQSSGTSFDLLGDGEPETIHADRSRVRIFSIDGVPLAELSRTARSTIAYPIVADIDGNGAADIVVVSSKPTKEDPGHAVGQTPTVMALRNYDDRFAPARRVWNQHTYHTTNIGEDGSVPVHESASWLGGSGFRTNDTPSTLGDDLCRMSTL